MELFVTKKVMTVTVVDFCYITLCLKCGMAPRSNSKSAKKNKKRHWNNMSNIFKVNNKDTRTTTGASIVNFEHIYPFILLLLLVNSNK